MFAKQNLLYREHNAQIEEMKNSVKQMEEKKNSAENARHLAEMQSKEYQNIIVTLERGMDEVQRGYSNSQRAVITLKTNEFNLVRRHSAMLEVETHLRKENSTLKADLRDLDKTARETISRLLRAKNVALFKVDNLLKKLDGKPKQMQKVLSPLPLCT